MRIRTAFYFLLLFFMQECLRICWSPAALNPVQPQRFLWPFSEIVHTPWLPPIAATVFCAALFAALIKNHWALRLLVFAAAYLVMGVYLSMQDSLPHSRWAMIFVAGLNVVSDDEIEWLQWSRIYLGLFYALSGVKKWIALFTFSDPGYLQAAVLGRAINGYGPSIVGEWIANSYWLSFAGFVAAGTFQIAVLALALRGGWDRIIALGLVAFHIFNHVFLDVLFFPHLALVILLFWVPEPIDSRRSQYKTLKT